MDIVYNLKKFFAEQQNEAAIPGLGVFYNSLTDTNGQALPTGSSVILFEEKTPRSNAFVNFLGYEENLTELEALDALEKWVAVILEGLKTTKVAKIPDLGTFEIKKDAVVFTPDPTLNPPPPPTPTPNGMLETPSSEYGLDNVQETLDKPDFIATCESSNTQKSNVWLVVLIVAATLVVLTGAGVVAYKANPSFAFWIDSLKNRSSAKPEAELIVVEPTEVLEVDFVDEDTLSGMEETPVKTEETDEQLCIPEPTVKSKSEVIANPTNKKPAILKYKVVGGSFAVRNNADKFQKQMKGKGFPANILFDEQKELYYVILDAFDSMEKALNYKEEIRSTHDIGCWIYTK